MKSSKFGELLQIGVSVSVLAGVALVGWELKQNNELAAHERLSEVNQLWTGIYQFEYENNVKMLYKKSIESPNELTDEEILRLDTWLNMVMDVVVLNDVQNRVHGLQSNPTELAAEYADYYFTSEFSRRWLQLNKSWYVDSPQLIQRLQEEIDKTPPSKSYHLLERLRFH